ncbi:unnamed protein product [[Candida] boidinii]|nr:unnamed protein product [[Candida] boidinii]
MNNHSNPKTIYAAAAPSAPASNAALDFKAAILAKLKNKKPAASAASAAPAAASSAPVAPSTPVASSLPEKPVSAKPVEKKTVEVPEQESKKETEPVTAEKPVAKEAPVVEEPVKQEAPAVEEPVKQEAPVAEEPVKSESSIAPAAVNADEPATQSDSLENESTETEQDKQEPKATEGEAAEEEQGKEQEEETPVDTYTISQFFDKVKSAKPIENVYEFKYPEGTKLPDTKFTKDSRRKYDPLFLLQFKDIINLPVDETWTEKFGSKIVIPKSTGKDNKSDRSFSKNGGQFGKGVIGGSGAPLLGSAMRNQNVRDFNGSRNGSRSGSKRGPREKSKRDRSDRGDRQQSRRHRGGESKEAERNPDGTIRPLDKPATVGFNNEPLPPPPTELKPLEKSAVRLNHS